MGKQVKYLPEDNLDEVPLKKAEVPEEGLDEQPLLKKKEEPKQSIELSGKDLKTLGKLSGGSSTGAPEKLSAKEYAKKFNDVITAGKQYGEAFKNGPAPDLPTKTRLAQDKAKVSLKEAVDNLNNPVPTQQETTNSVTELVEGKDIPIEDRILKAASDFTGGFNRAVLKTPSALLKTEAILANKLGKVLGDDTKVDDDFIYAAADKYDEWIDDSDFGKTWVGDKNVNSLAGDVGGGLGQVAVLMATGGEAGIAKLGGVTPSVFKQVVGNVLSKPTVIAFGQVFNAEYDGMKAAGESDDTAFKQAIINAVSTAPLENIPLANLAERFKKSVGSPIARRVVNALAQGGEEGGQEVLQQAFSNLTNNQLVEIEKNVKDWSSGLEQSGNAGGLVGLLLGTLSGVKAGRVKRSGQTVEETVKEQTENQSSDDLASIENAAEVIDEKVKQGNPVEPLIKTEPGVINFTESTPSTQNLESDAIQKPSSETVLSEEQGGTGEEGGQGGGVEPVQQGVSPAGEGQAQETTEVSDQKPQEEVKPRTIKVLTEEGGRALPRIKRKLEEGQLTPEEANAQVDELVKNGDVEFISTLNDEKNKPLTFYHGTKNKSVTKLTSSTAQQFGKGIYFGSDKNAPAMQDMADGGKFIEVHLPEKMLEIGSKEHAEITNKIEKESGISSDNDRFPLEKVNDEVKKRGYKGLIMDNDEYGGREAMVFNPEDVIYKSQPREGTAAEEPTTQGNGEETKTNEGQQEGLLTSEKPAGDGKVLSSPEASKVDQREEEIKKVGKPDVSLEFIDVASPKLLEPTGKKRIVKSGNRTIEKDETYRDKHNDIVKKQKVLKNLIDCLWR